MSRRATGKDGLSILAVDDADAWAAWLEKHGASSPGVWLRLAKKDSGRSSPTYAQAVEQALAYGWIDGHKTALDEHFWLQRFTRRGPKSIWSKINRDKALALIESGAMQPSGMAEVERAKKDGRWDNAYDSAKTATVPDDLAAALAANPRAEAFFATLDSTNRYAILFRTHHAKKAETRQKRIASFVEMLARHETIHPRPKGRK